MTNEFYNIWQATRTLENKNLVKLRSNDEVIFLNSDCSKIVARYETTDDIFIDADVLSEFREDIFVVNQYNNKDNKDLHIIERVKDGNHHTLGIYDYIELGEEDKTFAVKKNGLYGYIDINGELILEPEWDDYNSFSNGLASVKKGNDWFIINKQNEVVSIIPKGIELTYQEFSGLRVGHKDNKYGVLDSKGQEVIPFIYDNLETTLSPDVDIKIIGAKKGEKWGFIDLKGNEVLPFIYDEVEGTEQENYLVTQNGKIGSVCAIQQKQTIPCKYESIEFFYNDITVAQKGNKYGLIDKQGKAILDFEYDRINENYWDKHYILRKDRKYAITDPNGKIIIDFLDGRIDELQDELFTLETHKKNREPITKILNLQGETIFEQEGYNNITNLGKGFFLIEEPTNLRKQKFKIYKF